MDIEEKVGVVDQPKFQSEPSPKKPSIYEQIETVIREANEAYWASVPPFKPWRKDKAIREIKTDEAIGIWLEEGIFAVNKGDVDGVAEFILACKIKISPTQVVVMIPEGPPFDDMISTAISSLFRLCFDWCNVVESSYRNKDGLGVIRMNFVDLVAVNAFKTFIKTQSTRTPEVVHDIYPMAAWLRKHALTMYLHSGHYTRNPKLVGCITKCNPKLKGKLEILDLETLPLSDPSKSRHPRIVTLYGSREFLESLQQFPKKHKFRLGNKFFNIRGGI